MGAEKMIMCIIVVFLLLTIYNNSRGEKMMAANWVGEPGSDSVRPVGLQPRESFEMPGQAQVPEWVSQPIRNLGNSIRALVI